jgi:hypothetical protein
MTRKALAAVAMGAGLLGAVTAQAQTIPNTFTFTARVSNADGPLDGTHQIILRMYDQASAGTKLWEESHVDVQVNQGLVTLVMGSETNITNGDLTDAGVWVEVVIDGSTLAPRIQLRSVPYARRAADSVTLRGNAPSAFATAGHNHDSAYVDQGGDTMSGSLGINGDLNLSTRHALRGSDSWLRLNQDGAFTSGTHTPYNMNAAGLTVGALYYNPGGGNLHVQGVLTMSDNPGDCPAGWFCNGNFWDISLLSVYHNNLVQRSDRRLKKDIRSLAPGLGAILKLRPVTYRWKDPKVPGIHYGFIAQEVEKVLPELITESNKGFKALDATGILPVTVKAVQELKTENDELRADVDRLAAEIEALKAGRPLPPPASHGKTAARWLVPVGLGGGLFLVFAVGTIANLGRRRRKDSAS